MTDRVVCFLLNQRVDATFPVTYSPVCGPREAGVGLGCVTVAKSDQGSRVALGPPPTPRPFLFTKLVEYGTRGRGSGTPTPCSQIGMCPPTR